MVMLSGRSALPAGFNLNKPQPSDWPSMAAVAGRMLHYTNNLPPAVMLPEVLIHRTGRVIPGQFGGQMGAVHDPWVVNASPFNPTTYGAYPEYEFHHGRGAETSDNLRFNAPSLSLPQGLTRPRLAKRLDLVSFIDGQRRAWERDAEAQSLDRYRQQAISLLADPKLRRAFDVVHADARLLERYGNNQFGWSILMGKRLIEAGVRLIQINLGNDETWDTHQAAFPNLKNYLLPPMDRAVSALLDDLHESGMLNDTLVVIGSEFGRTPRVFTLPGVKLAGRDHWGAVQSLFFAGGGIPGGAIIGASDKLGASPTHDPQTPENLAATIYQALGIPKTGLWQDPLGRPHRVYHGTPIQFNA